MATPDPRHAYVTFYLTVLDDLDGVVSRLQTAHATWRAALEPFSRVLAAAGCEVIPPSVCSTHDLWRPIDRAQLTGLTDIYEVIGRFSFQGEDDRNLAAVGALVHDLRAEIDRQRIFLKSVGDVPTRAVAHADSLDAQDQASARAQQSDALKQFEPVAAEMRKLCATLLDAIRAVKKPDLARTDIAETLYQEYVTRVRALYARTLPYLRSELAELSRIAGCEVPPSWPDDLPFAPALPIDLVTQPSVEGPALLQARSAVESLLSQETALQRDQDELGVQLRRVEGEAASLAQREPDLLKGIATARTVVRWATRMDETDLLRAQLGGVQAELAHRGQAVAQIQAEGQRLNAECVAMQVEATEWAQGVAARDAAAQQHRENEPALFGRDEWRRKQEDLDAEAASARTELGRRQQALATMSAELVRLRQRDQAEQAQITSLQQAVEASRSREAALLREIGEIEKELGAARPARRLTVPQAEEAAALAQNARTEARARIDRLGAESRRIREDLDRAAVQIRQVTSERQRQQSVVAQASQAAAVALDDAVRVLATRRQSGFESHAAAVLAGLEDSLVQVDRVFVDPARRILLERLGVSSGASATLRAEAAQLTTALPEIQREAEGAWADAAAILDRVDREFVAKAPAACRAAWA